MSDPTYRVVRLGPEHDLTEFDCGAPAYNEWLHTHAAPSVQAGVCAVYLLLEIKDEDSRVVGYYAINPTQVARQQAPSSLARGWPDSVPAWKLGKLAIHVELRGDSTAQWGRQLLRAALETIVSIAAVGGGKVIVVDAEHPKLVSFYAANGFKATGMTGDRTLFLKVSTARRALSR